MPLIHAPASGAKVLTCVYDWLAVIIVLSYPLRIFVIITRDDKLFIYALNLANLIKILKKMCIDKEVLW